MPFADHIGTDQRQTPWGTTLDSEELTTAHDAFRNAGLDWTVSARDLYMVQDGENVGTPFRAIVNDSTEAIYGACRDRYETFQWWEQADFCELIADKYGAKMAVNAISFNHGAKVGILLSLGAMDCNFRYLTAEEEASWYLYVRNTHDGSGALTADPVGVRQFCTNQFPAIARQRKEGKGFVSIRHTSNMQERIKKAGQALGIVTRYAMEMDEIAARMANSAIEKAEIEHVITELIPVPEKRGMDKALERQDSLRRNIFGSHTLGDARGSRWGVLQGVTEFFQHEDEGRNWSTTPVQERAMLRNFGGPADTARQRAWELLAV